MNKNPIEKKILESFVGEIIKEKAKKYSKAEDYSEYNASIREVENKEERISSIMSSPSKKDIEKVLQEGMKREVLSIKEKQTSNSIIQIPAPSYQISRKITNTGTQTVGTPMQQKPQVNVIEIKNANYMKQTPLSKNPFTQKTQPVITPPPAPKENIKIMALTKIKPFLSDPLIQSVECPAPEKPVLINKSGAVQTTNISLSSEDIDLIMKEISEKTKIPLTPGVFKAALGDFIITAILSEFIGTRFVIQKRH